MLDRCDAYCRLMRKSLYGAVLVGAVALDLGSKELLVNSGQHIATLGGGRIETLDSNGSILGVYWHEASPARLAGMIALAAVCAGLLLLFRVLARHDEHGVASTRTRVALTLAAGGAIANALSLLLWHGNVPNILRAGSNAYCLGDVELWLGGLVGAASMALVVVRMVKQRRALSFATA